MTPSSFLRYLPARRPHSCIGCLAFLLFSLMIGCEKPKPSSSTEPASVVETKSQDLVPVFDFDQTAALAQTWLDSFYGIPPKLDAWTSDAIIVEAQSQSINRLTPEVWKAKTEAKQRRMKDLLTGYTWSPVAQLQQFSEKGTTIFSIEIQESPTKTRTTWDFIVKNSTPPKITFQQKRIYPSFLLSQEQIQYGSPVFREHVALSAGNDDLIALRGAPQLTDTVGESELWTYPEQLEDPFYDLARSYFNVYDASGTVCKSRPNGVNYRAYSRFPGDFFKQTYADLHDPAKVAPFKSSAEAIESLGRRLTSHHKPRSFVLGVHLDPEQLVGCNNPIFARKADLPNPTIWTQTPPTPQQRTFLLSKTTALPIAVELSQEAKTLAQVRTWYDLDASSVLLFRSPDTKETYAVTTLVGNEHCNTRFTNLFAVWLLSNPEANEQPDAWALKSVAIPKVHYTPFVPLLAADLDNSGKPAFFAKHMMVADTPSGYNLVANLQPIDYTRRCTP